MEQKINPALERMFLEVRSELYQHSVYNMKQAILGGIGATLVSATFQLSMISGKNGKEDKAMVQKAIDLIKESVEELRDVVIEQDEEQRAFQALDVTIEKEIRRFEKIRMIKIEYENKGYAGFISDWKELLILRLVQYILNDIMGNLKIRNLKVLLVYFNNHVSLKISGYGKIFSAGNLSSIKEIDIPFRKLAKRVSLVNGECKIKSIPGNGAMIVLTIPYKGPELLNH